MQKQKILLPAVETTPEFKEKVEQTCRTAGISYSAAVLGLLRKWTDQDIGPDIEPDPEFMASACEAFRSERVQKAIRRLAEKHSLELRPHFVRIGQAPSLFYAGRSPPLSKGEHPAFFIPEPLSEPGFAGLKDFQDLCSACITVGTSPAACLCGQKSCQSLNPENPGSDSCMFNF